ncbi:MAG: hypothetical protein JWN01_1206 [Patescibacteria group bacterium]|nr:hypothetical protein [Patescibacteria group bacterium]
MRINVRDILAESVGYSRAYKISGERPHLEGLELTQDIEGEITISRLDTGLLIRGRINTVIQLECHRCLSTFDHPISLNFSQLFATDPSDDELRFDDETVDLAPLMEQEITLALPIKILCRPDCEGIKEAAGKYTNEQTDRRLQNQARITKGTQIRGRT